MRTALLLSIASLLLITSPASADPPQRKKLIEVGWDAPSTAFLREHWREMETESPFDGVMFNVDLKRPDGQRIRTDWAWDSTAWKREWLRPAVDDLRACRFTRFTDNFLRFNASPGGLDWADDAAWQTLAEKLAACAWLTRQGGVKGLIFDPEPYDKHQFQFDPRSGRSFKQTCDLARKRGSQLMRAIAREYPDMTLLGFFFNSINFRAGRQADPDAVLVGEGYGLLPAFLNGLLDAAPQTMTLVDGCESGYYFDGELAYQKTAAQIRQWYGPASRLVAPENRGAYRRQVQAGFGFYLDMYLNEKGNRYYFGPKEGGTRLDRLRDNLSAALAASDEYVWVYGEQCRWWKAMGVEALGGPNRLSKTVGKGRLWEEAMPGLSRTLARVRDPLSAAKP